MKVLVANNQNIIFVCLIIIWLGIVYQPISQSVSQSINQSINQSIGKIKTNEEELPCCHLGNKIR